MLGNVPSPLWNNFIALKEKTIKYILPDQYSHYLDLMDYPESDDDGVATTDSAAMLDEEDTEQGDGPSTCLNPTVNVVNLAGPTGAPENASSNTVSAKKIARDKKNARLFRSILSYNPKVFVFFS
jgi:hypothetical protein